MGAPKRRTPRKVLALALVLAPLGCETLFEDRSERQRNADEAICRDHALMGAARESFQVAYHRCMADRGWALPASVDEPSSNPTESDSRARGAGPAATAAPEATRVPDPDELYLFEQGE